MIDLISLERRVEHVLSFYREWDPISPAREDISSDRMALRRELNPNPSRLTPEQMSALSALTAVQRDFLNHLRLRLLLVEATVQRKVAFQKTEYLWPEEDKWYPPAQYASTLKAILAYADEGRTLSQDLIDTERSRVYLDQLASLGSWARNELSQCKEPDKEFVPAEYYRSSGACVIASACIGADSPEVSALRRARDDAILSDPVARDFFHVFWSRYYEWSPTVARIASSDRHVADSIRWSFLDPWLAWLEFVILVGRRKLTDLSEAEQQHLSRRLETRLAAWLAELPSLMEEKAPQDSSEVFEAFDRFREKALKAIDSKKSSGSQPL